ncbi:MAG: prolyl oligopeptidase family serine peptidase [Fimbriimonadia bacterium]
MIVAAAVAAKVTDVTDVAMLAGGGPTQIFDMYVLMGEGAYRHWAEIRKDPDPITKMVWGHPYRRWSSFLAASPLDFALGTKAKLFIAHGTEDRSVPIAAFDVLRAELVARGRDVTAHRVEGANHGFQKPGAEPSAEGIGGLFAKMLDWYLGA